MKTPWFSDKTYDVLKYIAQIVLPAMGTLYFVLGAIWDLPKSEQVVATIVGVDAFLGALLQLSNKSYDESDTKYDGVLEVEEMPAGNKTFSLNLHTHPEDLESKDEIRFKVPQTPK
jgi:hypothetical protein